MLCNSSGIIRDGMSVALDVEWFDKAGVAAAPSSVDYRVFDYLTEAALSPVVAVAPTSESMSFVVPAQYLPATTAKRRRLKIQVRGTYPAGEYVIDSIDVYVERVFA